MIYIGIDPGVQGGIAWRRGADMPVAEKMPMTPHDLHELLHGIARQCMTRGSGLRCTCYLERVHSMPGQGVKSTFTFGRGFGRLEGVLASLKIPYIEVNPGPWQRALGIQKIKDEPSVAKKRRHKALAQKLFPNLRVTNANVDALLICEYAMRIEMGVRM